MDIVKEFISAYGSGIIYTVLAAIAAFFTAAAKKLLTKFLSDKTKREVAKTCVNATEQIYKNLHGKEKYNKCVEAISEMLAEKDIKISELEIKMLIESAVNELNNVFLAAEYAEAADEEASEDEENAVW